MQKWTSITCAHGGASARVSIGNGGIGNGTAGGTAWVPRATEGMVGMRCIHIQVGSDARPLP